MVIKSRLAAQFAVLAICAIPHMATAAIVDNFSISSSLITTGSSITEYLNLQANPDNGYFNSYFTGGTVTFNSGTGAPSQSFAVTYGSPSESFSATFNYPTSGSFTPGFSFTATYSEEYAQYTPYYYYVSQGYWQDYSCGFLCTGSYWVDTSYWAGGYNYYTVSNGGSGSGSTPLSVSDPSLAADVPEPSTWAMLIVGFAGLGFMTRRSRTGWR